MREREPEVALLPERLHAREREGRMYVFRVGSGRVTGQMNSPTLWCLIRGILHMLGICPNILGLFHVSSV